MAWSPKYNAAFTKALIRQLLAIVQRDSRAALDYVGGAGVLPDIVSYQLAPLIIPQFPAILIAPMQSVFVQESVGTLQSATRIYCAVAVTHQDGEVLAELVQDYVQALDAVFNTLPLYDFFSSWPLTHPILGNINTQPLADGSVKELFVLSHNYDEIRRVRMAWQLAATLELQIDREET